MFKRMVGSDVAGEGLKSGVNFPHQVPMPRFFALAPLYDHLVTRQVDIKSLNEDGTLSDITVSTVFTAVDVELWARRFLGDLDRFLVALMSTDVDGQLELSGTLAKAIDSKRTIALGIANQLQGVFDYSVYETDPDPDYEKGLQVARDTLTQLLQVSLIKAYDIPVIVQYDTPSTTSCAGEGDVPVSPDGQANLSNTAATVTPAATKTSFDPERAFVSFSATAADLEHHNVEHAVSPHHVASNASSFMPLPGAPRVPAPLRIYPAPPALVEQTASPTFDSPNDLQQLSLWTYKLALVHEFAAQDIIGITVEFNLLRQPVQRLASPLGADLFSTLAQYMTVANKLWMLLGAALDAKTSEATSCANATKTFADLAAAIANQWDIRSPQNKGGGASESDYVAEASYTVGVRVAYSRNRKVIESVSLIRKPSQFGPGDMLPEVAVLLPGGVRVPLLAQQSDASSLAVVYVPKSGTEVPASAWQSLQLSWNGLNVSAFQNARSRMSVVRNEDLLYDPLHPESGTPPTNPVFLLKTAEVVANSNVAPQIERNHQQDIHGADLQDALENAIQTLFPSSSLAANTRATWRLDYSYELAKNDTSPSDHSLNRARVPVAFFPNEPLDGIAQALATAGQEWIDTYQPTFDGESWMLSVVLHSGLEPDAHPLFSADLFYPINKRQALT